MDIDFYKLQICGNDLLLINNLGENNLHDSVLPKLSKTLCSRKYGVGANGVVYLRMGTEFDLALSFYSRTGKESKVIGDPLICAARYLFDAGFSGKETIHIETVQGIREIQVIDSRNFRISLGYPKDLNFDPITQDTETSNKTIITYQNRQIVFTPLILQSVGAAVYSDILDLSLVKKTARDLKQKNPLKAPLCPVFYTAKGSEQLSVSAWFISGQLGAAESVGIALIASFLNGFCDREVVGLLEKQQFYAQWLEKNSEVFITGSAEYVFSGSIYVEDDIMVKSGD